MDRTIGSCVETVVAMREFSKIFIALFFHTVLQCNATTEPACSKFDYEEKLLAKTIRLENTVDDLVKTVSHVQTGLAECQIDKKEIGLELETLKDDCEKQNTTMFELEARVDEITTRLKEHETESAQETTQCPSTYTFNAELNLCWRLEKDKRTDWLSASWKCNTEGGHLMILDSTAKIKFIQSFLVTAAISGNHPYVHVGGTDGMKEGQYKWVNGQPVGSIPWQSGEPTGNTNQNCLVIKGADKYDFSDKICSTDFSFLCQISL